MLKLILKNLTYIKIFESYLNKEINYDRINMIEKSIKDGIEMY